MSFMLPSCNAISRSKGQTGRLSYTRYLSPTFATCCFIQWMMIMIIIIIIIIIIVVVVVVVVVCFAEGSKIGLEHGYDKH